MLRMASRGLVFTVVVLMCAGAVNAQTTTHEVRRARVLHVYGNNLVVKAEDGTVREIDVDPDFRFDVNGRMVPVGELEPGMELTAVMTTTEVPRVVKTTEVRSGRVEKVVGQSLIIRTEDGTIRRFDRVPGDFPFYVDGQELTVFQLREGMRLTAYIVYESSEIVTEEEIQVAAVSAPKPAPAPSPARDPAPAPAAPAAAPAMLPATGSALPLVGLAGLLLIGLGLGIGILRRF